MNANAQGRPRVVVLGAGFAGLTFCQAFSCPDADVTVVDRQNHHLFQPLLYQVATAGLSAPEIAQPIRSILRKRRNTTVLLRSVTGVDLARHEVQLEGAALHYDYLVMALGGVTSYFGHPQWERFAPGLKSLDDALRIRREILLAFEVAENGVTAPERERLMTIVVVGGGPTGVELAGAFAELTRHVLKRDFRRIDPQQAHIVLLEAGPRLLPQFIDDIDKSRTRAAPTPTNISTKSLPLIKKNGTFASPATARAKSVLPKPQHAQHEKKVPKQRPPVLRRRPTFRFPAPSPGGSGGGVSGGPAGRLKPLSKFMTDSIARFSARSCP